MSRASCLVIPALTALFVAPFSFSASTTTFATYSNRLTGHRLSKLAATLENFLHFTALSLAKDLFCWVILARGFEEEDELVEAMADLLWNGTLDLRVSMNLSKSLIVINLVSLKSL